MVPLTLLLQKPAPQLQELFQLLRTVPLQVVLVLPGTDLVLFPLHLGGPSPWLCCSPFQCRGAEFKVVLPIIPILPDATGTIVFMHLTAQDHLQDVGLRHHSQLTAWKQRSRCCPHLPQVSNHRGRQLSLSSVSPILQQDVTPTVVHLKMYPQGSKIVPCSDHPREVTPLSTYPYCGYSCP